VSRAHRPQAWSRSHPKRRRTRGVSHETAIFAPAPGDIADEGDQRRVDQLISEGVGLGEPLGRDERVDEVLHQPLVEPQLAQPQALPMLGSVLGPAHAAPILRRPAC